MTWKNSVQDSVKLGIKKAKNTGNLCRKKIIMTVTDKFSEFWASLDEFPEFFVCWQVSG